ncbi:MAG: hypothetical protein EHM72_10405 [Calditrichaeota bacterium]|nr:MAG: hypothetical protein EHM72_10405 [Calditrichota bacterium]
MIRNDHGLTLRLVHWNRQEAEERARQLTNLGYCVDADHPAPPSFVHSLAASPPKVVVIDLTRLPSQGRDLGILIRKTGATRLLPLVFIGGDAAKVQAIREILPDAIYTSWETVEQVLRDAIHHPPQNPIKPNSIFEAYAGKTLLQKLGISPNCLIGFINTPEGFIEQLGELPTGIQIHSHGMASDDIILWFVRSKNELEKGISTTAQLIDHNRLWIMWPKRASGISTDLSQQIVRETGLAAELVDYKICAVDSVWSGLLFTRRKIKASVKNPKRGG